ncbi:MAG: DUF4405 domain-containing protein [Chloroflexota bacterium]|jgi:hypothetical protein
MSEIQSSSKNLTRVKLTVDLVIFFAFLIAMDPRSSGIAVHEWLATAALAALIVHLLLSWDWIVQISRRFVGKVNLQTRINYILNWLLFIDGSVMMLSGFMISEAVFPSLGIKVPVNFAWRSLHDMTANLFLLLLGLHTALHWGWVVDTFKRYIFKPLGRLVSFRRRKDVTA